MTNIPLTKSPGSVEPYLLQRMYPEPAQSEGDHRHAAERDRDRILHSSAFRRLQGKTQVFGIGQADFYRTRLTHSIEAAQLARSIARNLLVEEPGLEACLTPELAEAAALAHDLGHPPFGHAGEQTLDACMKEVNHSAGIEGRSALRFEANAQTFHILVAAEPKSPDFPGLNLTRGTLAGVVKYPFKQEGDSDKFIFNSDEASAVWALDRSDGLLPAEQCRPGFRPATSVVCQILNWADDCAYSIHDVEDALQSMFLRASDLSDGAFVEKVAAQYEKSRIGEGVPPIGFEEIRDRLRSLGARIQGPGDGDELPFRKMALRNILNELVISVGVEPAQGHRRPDYAWVLRVPSEARILAVLCKSVVWEAVITDPRVTAVCSRGREVLKELFQRLMVEVREKNYLEIFPRSYQPVIRDCAEKGEAAVARGVCNFLALLTDMDAFRFKAALNGKKESYIFDLI
jgi:dGTPase